MRKYEGNNYERERVYEYLKSRRMMLESWRTLEKMRNKDIEPTTRARIDELKKLMEVFSSLEAVTRHNFEEVERLQKAISKIEREREKRKGD